MLRPRPASELAPQRRPSPVLDRCGVDVAADRIRARKDGHPRGSWRGVGRESTTTATEMEMEMRTKTRLNGRGSVTSWRINDGRAAERLPGRRGRLRRVDGADQVSPLDTLQRQLLGIHLSRLPHLVSRFAISCPRLQRFRAPT